MQPGGALDVLLTLSPPPPPASFGTPVTFTGCTIISGGPGPINCTFNPPSVPDVNQVRSVHMLVQTFAAQAQLTAPAGPGRSNPVQLALLLPGFVGVFGMVILGGSKKSRRRTALWFGASLLLLALLLVGCGGGGQPITPGPTPTAPGQYVLQVNMSGTANPPIIQVQVNVP